MQAKLQKHGKSTSQNLEIQNISKYGIWVLIFNEEFFLTYDKYPWFQKATVEQIYHVELHHGKHLYWPDLDIDLELESLRSPEKYPLTYR